MHIHQYRKGSTIAAIATAPGEGAIAVIRISGPDALRVAKKIFSGPVEQYKSHTSHFGKIVNELDELIDHVLLLVFRAPRSYTGEEIIEIHCHGGSLIAKRVLETVFKAGARPALPGEFTFQAFCNGKLDLAQAEAVQKLIASKSDLAHQSASAQLEGALSNKIGSFQKELTRLAAILEAWVDFPEEGLEFTTMEKILQDLETCQSSMQRLLETFDEGKVIHDGLHLCLLGSPNVGKSSLMNALLGQERAIVTPIAGTTRDLIEEPMKLGGLFFKLIDTAGIRTTEEEIEQEGIRRSLNTLKRADLVLLLLDASRPLNEYDRNLLASCPENKTLFIWNKIDLSPPKENLNHPHIVHLSAKNQTGLDELKQAIENMIWKKGPPSKEEVILTSLRHYQALSEAISFLSQVMENLKQDVSPEFIAFDLRSSLHSLSSILGTDVSEDILSSIFSQFCLGK